MQAGDGAEIGVSGVRTAGQESDDAAAAPAALGGMGGLRRGSGQQEWASGVVVWKSD